MISKDLQLAISFECDSIRGNLNRMCVCDSEKELNSQLDWSLKRVETLYKLNMMRLREKKLGVKDE